MQSLGMAQEVTSPATAFASVAVDDLDLPARNASDELDLSVEIDTLTVVMQKSGLVKVSFILYCMHPSIRYSLSVSTENTKVALVDGSAMFNLSCADAVVLDSNPKPPDSSQGEGDGNAGTSAPSAGASTEDPHPHDLLLQALPAVRGSFNFTLYGDLLGRTWLRIHGERGAAPDVAELPVFLKLPWTPLEADLQDHHYVNSSDIIITDSANDREPTYDATAESETGADHLSESGPHLLQRHVITVKRVIRPVDIAFRSVLYGFVIAVTVGMGCKMEISVVKAVLKKPVAPAIGFICQYLFMPLIAFMLAKTLTVGDPAVSLGIFACGICPGGGPSNMFSYLLDGDVSLSVTMTAISSVGALAMIPLWLFTLGAMFQDDKISLTVPFARIFMTLAILIVPLFVGILIKHKLPKVAKIIQKFLKPLTLVAILFLVTFGIYANLYVFRLFAPRTLAAGCLLPYIGYILGGLASLVFRQPCYRVKTIAIETGIQNTSIAYLLLIFSLPTPDGDMAAVGPAASAIMTPLPLFVLVLVYLLYKRFCKKKKEGEEEEGGERAGGEGVALKNSSDKEEKNGSAGKQEKRKQKKKQKEKSRKNGEAESEKFIEEKPKSDV
nr:hypothetical protein BaRGS_014039 [Batillaria attramentaria]